MAGELISPVWHATKSVEATESRQDELRRAITICQKLGGTSPEVAAIVASLNARMLELNERRNIQCARLDRLFLLERAEQVMRETTEENSRKFASAVQSFLQAQGEDAHASTTNGRMGAEDAQIASS